MPSLSISLQSTNLAHVVGVAGMLTYTVRLHDTASSAQGDDDHEVELAIDDDAPPPAKRTRFGLDLDALGYLRQSLGNLQGTPPPDDDERQC